MEVVESSTNETLLNMQTNKAYWNNEGSKKTFTHNLNIDWLNYLQSESKILDFGCGYGRLTPELLGNGFTSLYGYDFSTSLIEKAKLVNPGSEYSDQLDIFQEKTFDLIICFALFTCCPSDHEQRNIVEWIDSVTSKGSRIYISDYVMIDNPHYKDRYNEKELGIVGCFQSGNATFRHHEEGHFERLFSSWTKSEESISSTKSLNGNSISVHQYIFIKK